MVNEWWLRCLKKQDEGGEDTGMEGATPEPSE
jgi:hypothetical protein